MKRRGLFLVILLGCGGVVAPPLPTPAGVVRVETLFPGTAKWVRWLTPEGPLVVSTLVPDALIQMATDGRWQPALRDPLPSGFSLSPSHPWIPDPQGSWLLPGLDGKFLRLDADLRAKGVVGPIRFPGFDPVESIPAGVLWGERLVALVSCRTPRQFHPSFFGYGLCTLGGESTLDPLWPLDPASNAGGLAWLFPTLARAGNAVFVLLYDAPMRIQQLLPQPRTLRAFPTGLGEPPDLAINSPSPYFTFMANVERATAPVGLYGQGEKLFLLTRQPAEDGTRWHVHRLDPVRDRLEASVELPTRAPHLRLAPGPVRWAVLELARPEADGAQRSLSLLLLPSAALAGK